MFFVIGFLNGSPSVGLVYGFLHGARYDIRIHDDTSIDISGSTATGLYQRTC